MRGWGSWDGMRGPRAGALAVLLGPHRARPRGTTVGLLTWGQSPHLGLGLLARGLMSVFLGFQTSAFPHVPEAIGTGTRGLS